MKTLKMYIGNILTGVVFWAIYSGLSWVIMSHGPAG